MIIRRGLFDSLARIHSLFGLSRTAPMLKELDDQRIAPEIILPASRSTGLRMDLDRGPWLQDGLRTEESISSRFAAAWSWSFWNWTYSTTPWRPSSSDPEWENRENAHCDRSMSLLNFKSISNSWQCAVSVRPGGRAKVVLLSSTFGIVGGFLWWEKHLYPRWLACWRRRMSLADD